MISEHFSLNEMTRTKEKIDYVPNEAQVENHKILRNQRWIEKRTTKNSLPRC